MEWSVQSGAGGWNTTFGEWQAEGEEIAILSDCRMECVLPDGGAFHVSITLEGIRGSQRIGIELDDLFFHLGAESHPGLKIELMNRVIAAAGRGVVDQKIPGCFVCERSDGELRLHGPGGASLEAPDPTPHLPIKALALHLPWGTRFTALKLKAAEFLPAPPPLPHPNKLDLSFCIDFFDDLLFNPWTKDTFRECMAYFGNHGFRRMYFIDHFGQSGGWWRRAGHNPRFPGHQEFIDQTFRNVGDFLPAAVSSAKAAGLEAFAVLKPFEAAMFHSTPDRPEADSPNRGIRSLGGWNPWCTDFAANHPEFRLERNMTGIPADLATRKVGSIILRKQDGLHGNFDASRLCVWTSRNNGTYTLIPGRTLRMEYADACRVKITGEDLGGPFFALTYNAAGGPPVFGNLFDNLVEIFDTEGTRLPITFSTVVNPPGTDFTKTGFVMDADAVGKEFFWLDRGLPLGIAVGVEQFLQGALCPAYPEVRAWWLEQVHQCLASGVDGIDFRVCAHSRTLHWDAYGFNQPIVEAFQARHGINILQEPFDRRDLRILTGEFYTEFLREAHRVIKAAGKSMHLHLELGFQEADQSSDLEIYFNWREWLKEGLADEVCIKNVRCMQSPMAQNFASFARKSGVSKVHFNPSMNILTGHPAPREFFDWVVRDAFSGGADGFVLYETWAILAANSDSSIRLTLPWVAETLSQSV